MFNGGRKNPPIVECVGCLSCFSLIYQKTIRACAIKPSPRGKVGTPQRMRTGRKGWTYEIGIVILSCTFFGNFSTFPKKGLFSKAIGQPLPPIVGTLWEPSSCPLASHTRRVSLDTLAPAPRCFGSTVQHKRYSIVCASLTPRGRLYSACPYCFVGG